MIKEVIVVEGRDDITAVKAAIDAEVIASNGFGYKKDFIETLKKISQRRGIIILTDPDYAGEQIRRTYPNIYLIVNTPFYPRARPLKR